MRNAAAAQALVDCALTFVDATRHFRSPVSPFFWLFFFALHQGIKDGIELNGYVETAKFTYHRANWSALGIRSRRGTMPITQAIDLLTFRIKGCWT